MSQPSPPPLEGLLVLDLTRMLPGAILTRQLVDLGARCIKVEDPVSGDPMRHLPPQVAGLSAAWAALLRGTESIGLDLTVPSDAARLRRLARSADVLVESFRPGTMQNWGLGATRLQALNPALVVCSLSAFGAALGDALPPAHDLNLVAATGLLRLLDSRRLPQVQLADVGAALLAASAVLAALVARARTGRGAVIDQPLVTGPLPFLLWSWADGSAGSQSLTTTLLAGRCPAYGTYLCADDQSIALAALEPKFWGALVDHLGLPEHAGAGLDAGVEGQRAGAAVARALRSRPRRHWLDVGQQLGLPISPVDDLRQATGNPLFTQSGLLEQTPLPDGGTLEVPGPLHPSLGTSPRRPAPALGQDTGRIIEEFGLAADDEVTPGGEEQ